MHSFNHNLHEVPTILDILPPAALKNLSATCRTLQTSFCARVTVITVSGFTEISKLCCTTWPQLKMVVCALPSKYDAEATSQPSAEWENMMAVELVKLVSRRPYTFCSRTIVMLVRSYQKLKSPLTDLSSHHCIAVSSFADKHRDRTLNIHLRGPCVGSRAVQSLTNDVWPAFQFLKVVEAARLEHGSMSLLINMMPCCKALSFRIPL